MSALPIPTPAVDEDDDALMRAFAQGDGAAFERLYGRHRSALYRFVRRLLGSAGSAQTDEVFQDTWLRVVAARERWAPQGATFRTWLFTLAHHRAIDLLRKGGRELPLAAEGDGELPREPWQPAGAPWQDWPVAGGPEDLSFWRAAGRRLLDCLDTLPLSQRSAFLLHHEDGLALAELAQALGVGFETAKSRLRYAMAKLRTCMGAYLPGNVLP
jgi:RNA polymerase sigma-70 factor (ECF subfamily)